MLDSSNGLGLDEGLQLVADLDGVHGDLRVAVLVPGVEVEHGPRVRRGRRQHRREEVLAVPPERRGHARGSSKRRGTGRPAADRV